MCRKRRSRDTHKVVNHPTDDSNMFYAGSITCPDDRDAWTVSLNVAGKRVTFKIDTDADVTVMSKGTFDQLSGSPKRRHTSTLLTSPGGRVNCCGEFTARSAYKGPDYEYRVVVVEHSSNLLARSVACRMGLVKRVDEIRTE